MLIRIVIKYVGDIDILTCFLEYHLSIKYYLYAFAYFITNYFIGLSIGELLETLLVSLIKEDTTHFLGILLSINRSKFPLNGPFNYKYSSNIKEIPVKENTVLLSSREPNSPRESLSSSSSNRSSYSSIGRRSLSPFSRIATPTPQLGPNDIDPSLQPNNLPNTPLNPSEIQPEYFRRDGDISTAASALDDVINNIWKATYRIFGPEVRPSPNNIPMPIWLPPFTPGGPNYPGPPQANHPFHIWNQINSMDQCTELHLRCIIARLEHAKERFTITGGGVYYLNDQPNFPKGYERVTINQALDRLLVDANRSLNTRFPHRNQ